MRFYTTTKLGPKRSRTPEGFLICHDVPLARTGFQIYGPKEVPVSPGPDGKIRVEREADEVFRPETMASANGKAFCNEHPDEDVTPLNWRELAKGHISNPHRGTGIDEDLFLADIVVTDPVVISLIEANEKIEISLGYDAEYEEIGPGHGRQTNIFINHAALVEHGRCGPRCAIGDHRTTDCQYATAPCGCHERTDDMARFSVMDMLRKARGAKDETELEAIAKTFSTKDEDGSVHVHMHGGEDHKYCDADAFEAHVAKNDAEHAAMRDSIEGLRSELTAMKGGTGDKLHARDEAKEKEEAEKKEVEDSMEAEAPPGTGDSARKSKDSALLEESFRDTAALAEILSPGIRIPSFDKAFDPKKGLDAIDALRTSALELAYNSSETRGMVDEVLNGRPFDLRKMTRDSRRGLFNSVAAIRKRANNKDAKDAPMISTSGGGLGPLGVQNPAELNRILRERRNGKAA